MKYVFKAEGGCCPQCIAFDRVYFIQDKYIGGDKYEYALMSRPIEKKVAQKFLDEKGMISFLLKQDISDEIAANLLLSQMTVYRSGTRRMLEYNETKYVWDSIKKELKEYIEPIQETGYCDTYTECLNLAKDILKMKETESIGVQMNLFD